MAIASGHRFHDLHARSPEGVDRFAATTRRCRTRSIRRSQLNQRRPIKTTLTTNVESHIDGGAATTPASRVTARSLRAAEHGGIRPLAPSVATHTGLQPILPLPVPSSVPPPVSLRGQYHLSLQRGTQRGVKLNVIVIDAKNYTGRVEQRVTGTLFRPGPPALFVRQRNRTSLVAGVRKQVVAQSAPRRRSVRYRGDGRDQDAAG